MTRGAIAGDDIAFTAEDEANMRELINAAKDAARASGFAREMVTIYADKHGAPFDGLTPLEWKAKCLRLLAGDAVALMNELARDGVSVSFSIARDEDEGYTARVKITKVTEL